MPQLYLIPNKIGDLHIEMQLPAGLHDIIFSINHFIVEDIRNARRFIKNICPEKEIDGVDFMSLNKHTAPEEISGYLAPIARGYDIGLLSEAGVPCIADPGAVVVKMAHEQNIGVMPVMGPSSILLSLMASGMNGQHFCFHGYLPVDRKDRIRAIKEMEKESKSKGRTEIFIETPYRNNQVFQDLVSNCHENTRLCLGVELYNQKGAVRTKTIEQWKKSPEDLHKKMVVFLINAS